MKQYPDQESADPTPTLGGNRNLKSARGTPEDIEAVVPRLHKPVDVRSETGFCAVGTTSGAPQISPEVRAKLEKALMREARRLRLFYLFRIYLRLNCDSAASRSRRAAFFSCCASRRRARFRSSLAMPIGSCPLLVGRGLLGDSGRPHTRFGWGLNRRKCFDYSIYFPLEAAHLCHYISLYKEAAWHTRHLENTFAPAFLWSRLCECSPTMPPPNSGLSSSAGLTERIARTVAL